jgi:YiiM-like, 3-alpha helix domain
MACLVSVNVGLPRDIQWRGRTVHTTIWKEPVQGRSRVKPLNVEGDGQADLGGHGGEQRAVFVYQIESYRYWEKRLGRGDQLERALRIPALSPGWRWSFEALKRNQDAHPGAPGNAGLMPAAAAQTTAPEFRPLRVSRIDRECADVISLSLQPADGRPLTTPPSVRRAVPGQR